jgi:hypothetical protein
VIRFVEASIPGLQNALLRKVEGHIGPGNSLPLAGILRQDSRGGHEGAEGVGARPDKSAILVLERNEDESHARLAFQIRLTASGTEVLGLPHRRVAFGAEDPSLGGLNTLGKQRENQKEKKKLQRKGDRFLTSGTRHQ